MKKEEKFSGYSPASALQISFEWRGHQKVDLGSKQNFNDNQISSGSTGVQNVGLKLTMSAITLRSLKEKQQMDRYIG